MINTLLLLGILLALIGILREEIRIKEYRQSPSYIKDIISQMIEANKPIFYLRRDKRFKNGFRKEYPKDCDINIKEFRWNKFIR